METTKERVMSTSNNINLLKKMVDLYKESNSTVNLKKVNELEVRFGIFQPSATQSSTNSSLSKKPITRIDFENVVRFLRASGFILNNASDGREGSLGKNKESAEQYYLRVIGSTVLKTENKRETLQFSNTRLEIRGMDLIQKYCTFNDISKILADDSSERWQNTMKFTQKTLPLFPDGSAIDPINFSDFNYRVSYKIEEDFGLNLQKSKEMMEDWGNKKKIFRFLKRYRFSHPDLPVFIDMSIVKTNQKDKKTGVFIPTYTIQDSQTFGNAENYEIEIELDNDKITKNVQTDIILGFLRKTIHIVLSGLQKTSYPISYSEQDEVLSNYLNLIHSERTEKYNGRNIRQSDFFGPSSQTLQIENLLSNSKINILDNYAVTDKADGERKLLYVSPVVKSKSDIARIYLIDTNLNVTFTGKTTLNRELFNTLIDGEHILYDKLGNLINQYMAFDIYFTYDKKEGDEDKDKNEDNNQNSLVRAVRNYKFMRSKSIPQGSGNIEDKGNQQPSDLTVYLKEKYRYPLLVNRVKEIGLQNDIAINTIDKCSFIISTKEFYYGNSIFESCRHIFNKEEFLVYNTDGLIFTPIHLPIPIDNNGFKVTWNHSFKWKPTYYNTIDFYVTNMHDKNGKDMIKSNFVDGQDLSNVDLDKPYKIIELRCGYSKNDNRHKNPYNDVLKILNEAPEPYENKLAAEEVYTPELFKPTNPFDPLAYLCYVALERDDSNKLVMKTEEGEIFDENTIVEFRYDADNEYSDNAWRWKPLRVRYDKTNKLLSGEKEFGNAFHVANNNWHSIHSPITQNMLSFGENIPVVNETDEVYYDNNPESKSNHTKNLRIFHNIVKRKLIHEVAGLSSDKTLIDYAVGKAGDLQKWTASKIEFVFGIDLFRDNIINSYNGACVRYLQNHSNFRSNFRGLFVTGDSSQHIRSGKAMSSMQEQNITRTIFSSPGEQYSELSKKYNGIVKNGFQISSCQFAIHYFFENQNKLHGFLRNVAECTKLGGYFIGTTYDGSLVFEKLKNYKRGEGVVLSEDTKVADEKTILFKIIKQYDETGFPDDENSLGYKISVFQDSIGKAMDEYLVNFEYFKRVMGNYGFALVDPTIQKNIRLKSGSGYFQDFYNEIIGELKKNSQNIDYKKVRDNMSNNEKFISFMNRYFVFKKVSEVSNIESIYKVKREIAEKKIESESESERIASQPFKITKLRSNFVMSKFRPIDDEDDKTEKTEMKNTQSDFMDDTNKMRPFVILVPFREQKGEDRKGQLDKFIAYMTEYLKDVNYKIYIIQQSDDGLKFNRGKLLNAGFDLTSKQSQDDFSHYIFHDVDLLPSEELKKFYTMVSDNPIHLAHVWKDRYDYANYFGGVVSFSKKTFENINGFPNNFFGWGSEDNLLYYRTNQMKYSIIQPNKGSYTDLENLTFDQKNKLLKATDQKDMLQKEKAREDKKNWKKNGLNNLVYNVLDTRDLNDTSIMITVDVTEPI
jgi:hypothetical protein